MLRHVIDSEASDSLRVTWVALNNIIIINIMFEYLGLAYRNSDYTAVIAIL